MTDAAPNPRSLILKLLLAADGEGLTAREAIGSCGLFGIQETSVRVTLARLASDGLVESVGRGVYRLGANATGLAADVATWRTAEKRVKEWRGAWVAAHVGGLGRTDRAVVRARERALGFLGMRELDSGLYVRPDNLAGSVEVVRERLRTLGLEAAAPVFRADGLEPAHEQRARRLWDGKALTKGYRDGRRGLEQWLSRCEDLDPEAAARESFLLGNRAIQRLVFDPLLPAPLVDVDERRAFSDAVQRFDQAGHAIWRRMRAQFLRRPADDSSSARAL